MSNELSNSLPPNSEDRQIKVLLHRLEVLTRKTWVLTRDDNSNCYLGPMEGETQMVEWTGSESMVIEELKARVVLEEQKRRESRK